jgi:Fe2+ transport system protein FeoA
MKCSMCGTEFDTDAAARSCGGCPLVGNCGLVRCPACGFDNVPESRLVTWVRGLGRGRRRCRRQTAGGWLGPLTMADLPPGQPARVVGVVHENAAGRHTQKLIAMGVFPGAQVVMQRRSPGYVFQIGFSQFAVDSDVARSILVQVEGGRKPHGRRLQQ